jgi:hypothetical protein
MQIRTITCHDVYNHGASLQAYALQTYLESIGHTVEIIDYKPDYLSRHYQLWSIDNPIYDKPIIKQLYLVAKLPVRLLALKRKRLFDIFTKRYLKLTTKRYHSSEELKRNPPQADVYIAGSDQIWNTLFPNGRDAAFYLDFAPKASKRISYAASFATEDVVGEYKPFVRRMLQNFDVISIRERYSLPLLKSLGRDDGVAVCDPVFLLSREQWESFLPSKDDISHRYLLVYDTEGSVELSEIARRIAKEMGLKIYNVSAFRRSYADEDFWASSPLDFVCLVRDASYVVSNSFHATAFSLIFERNFCVVNRCEGINERMRSILLSYGLEDRLVTGFSASLLSQIDFEKVRLLLRNDIAGSKEFLERVLSIR